MDKNRQGQVMEINLFALVRALWHRAWAVILAMIILGGAFFAYSYLGITPLYQSKVLFYVNNSSFALGSASVSISSAEITAAKSLVDTYIVILKTRATLNAVIDEAKLPYRFEQLNAMISAESISSTEIFSVTVTSQSAAEAEHIANTIAWVLPDRIADVVDGSSVRIVDYAVRPGGKVSPSLTRYAMIGAMLGFLLSALIIFLIEYFDEKIYSEDYLTMTYNKIPLLAVIPDMSDEKSKKSYYAYSQKKNADTGRQL